MPGTESRYQVEETIDDRHFYLFRVVDTVADIPMTGWTVHRLGAETACQEIRDDLEGPDPDNPRSL